MARRRVDINTATVSELETLVGVGTRKAEAIVKHRKELGAFENIGALNQVAGIGSSIVDQNKRRLSCRPLTSTTKSRNSGENSGSSRQSRLTRRLSRLFVTVERREEDATAPTTSNTRQSRGNDARLKEQLKVETPEISSSDDANPDSQGDTDTPWDCVEDNMELASQEENSEHVRPDNDHDDDSSSSEEEDEERDSEDNQDEEDSEDEDGEDCQQVHSDCHCRHRLTEATSCCCKHAVKKRKPGSSKDDGASPSKKFCGIGDGHSAFTSWKLSTRPTVAISRQRIPSKENPPPKLAEWLQTFQAWSNAERLMAVDELIAICEPTQVRHMMQVIEPQFQRDFISLLPKELALYVLSFLEPKDLLRAAQTCRYWRILAEDNLLWREKCREESVDESLVYGSHKFKKPRAHRSPWKALYMRQYQIEQNWRTGAIRPPKVLKGHDDHVITCLEFCGTRIVSGSDDNTLKVWSAISGKCLRTLVGHTGGVWSSQMSGLTVISGSTDRTLKVWNAETGVCKHTLYGHTSTVRCMSLYGSKVVSGSRDATLRVWDIESGQCLHVLMGHVAAVRCVQYDGRRVVSGAYDYTVRVWDPETESCLHTLQGHTNRVYSLQFDGVHVVSGSLDTSIRVWDVETGNCLHTLIGHQSLTSGLELKDNILVSGNADSTVKVWDITTGQCLQTLQGPNKHQSAVTCLQFNKKFVITSSDDGTVKIWDLKHGDFLRNLVALDSGGSGGVVWRLRCNNTKLVCAVGSRNGTEETKLLVLDFDVEDKKLPCVT
ncbi:F-box/WD repeat-containing protein 7-like [Haliotis cracherodii]|uniref:F-box/WD repeat-containing protein 7-like n=1 Tax=Haliotis cracherodii TaxID=6455 RepID=UPI0039E90375